MIRLTIPSIDSYDLEAVSEALASGYLVQGARVASFEKQVAGYVGAEHAVAVSNCTSALLLALMAIDVGAGDKVAVTAYSWPATANVIALCGAEPLFVDVEPSTFNMDPDCLDQALRKARVKAILPVHTFGGIAAMPQLMEIAARHEVPIIEDAACALGSELNGRRAGVWGIMGCFSFHPRKAITTGEGGLIATNDADLAKRLRVLRNHGQDPDAPAPDFIAPGHNMRLTEFQAALGCTQMAKIERIIESRRAQAANYDALLEGSGITPPRALPGSRHVYQSYAALLPAGAALERGRIIAALKEHGIETTIGTYHIPLTTYFRKRYGYHSGDFPVSDEIAGRAISLPLFEALTVTEQKTVVTHLREQIAHTSAAKASYTVDL